MRKLYIGLLLVELSLPKMINEEAPINPKMTPINLILLNESLNIKMPMIKVHIGVRLLSKPARELLICVCAKENKNAGMPLPVSPTATNFGHKYQSISFLCQYTTGEKANDEIPNLRQAN